MSEALTSKEKQFVSYCGVAIGGLFGVKRKVVIPDVHRCDSTHPAFATEITGRCLKGGPRAPA